MHTFQGSPAFKAYARTLQRVYWSEFVDAQIAATRPSGFNASLVKEALPENDNFAKIYDYHRHRTALVAAE